MRTRVLMGIAMLLPIAAFAHAHLESSVPANGSTVKESPPNVMLMFSESVGLDALTLQKAGDKATKNLEPLPQKNGEHLMVPLPKLEEGEYVLAYKAVATDMHESKGTIRFKVSASATSADAKKDCCAKHMDHMKPDGDAGGHDHAGADAPK